MVTRWQSWQLPEVVASAQHVTMSEINHELSLVQIVTDNNRLTSLIFDGADWHHQESVTILPGTTQLSNQQRSHGNQQWRIDDDNMVFYRRHPGPWMPAAVQPIEIWGSRTEPRHFAAIRN